MWGSNDKIDNTQPLPPQVVQNVDLADELGSALKYLIILTTLYLVIDCLSGAAWNKIVL